MYTFTYVIVTTFNSQLGIFSALHIAATLNFAQPDAMKVITHNTNIAWLLQFQP